MRWVGQLTGHGTVPKQSQGTQRTHGSYLYKVIHVQYTFRLVGIYDYSMSPLAEKSAGEGSLGVFPRWFISPAVR
jgi:hypothetical protein